MAKQENSEQIAALQQQVKHSYSPLKQQLHTWLLAQAGISETFWSNDSGGFYGFVYKGKEFAHFHQGNELDLKLGRTSIAEQGLQHPAFSLSHPKRSPRSAWIELGFSDQGSLQQIQVLVLLAISPL
ncbi:luciferase family protein [Agarivorans sp. DSG3-1]|uniref:luciferase family protein n=1 Tax=Agarivorans sp. DSG3-1 TaxID=3342249 RepID=UPI00398E8910